MSKNIEAKLQPALVRIKALIPICLSHPTEKSSELLRHLTKYSHLGRVGCLAALGGLETIIRPC